MNSNLFAKPLDTSRARTFMGLEALMYQGENFLSALASGIKKIKEKGKFDTASLKEADLSGIASKFTGMNVTIQISQGYNAYMYMPPMDNSHPFQNNYLVNAPLFGAAGEMVLKGKSDPIAEINYETATVGGVYSDIPVNIFIGRSFFGNTFTNEEIAAIILHEVGHAYTYFYYLGRMFFANFLISSYAQEIMGTRDVDRRKILIKAAERRLGLEIYNPNALAEQPTLDKNKVETLFINAHRYTLANTTGTDIYDFRACEQLADYFATMHGAGPHLISGLNKFYEMSGNMAIMPFPIFMIGEFFKLLMTPFTLPVSLLVIMVTNPSIKRYDDPAARAKYIELQMRSTLKDRNLDPEMRKSLLASIEAAGKHSVRLTDYKGLDHLLWTVLSPQYRRGVKQEQSQKILENILFNDLYTKSAAFAAIESYSPFIDEAAVAIAESRQDNLENDNNVDYENTDAVVITDVISEESAMVLAGLGIRVALMAFAKLWDSTGQAQYSKGIKLHREAQTNNFTYGLDNAIPITDKTKVAQYLAEHADGKFKAVFKTVRDLIHAKDIHLALKDETKVVAEFIAEDLAKYPHIREEFHFTADEGIINTSVATNYDKFSGLLAQVIWDKNYAPWNALVKDWKTVENRVQSLYKVLHEQIQTMTTPQEFSINYSAKNLSALSLIESQFSDSSFFKRKSLAVDSLLFKHILPSLSAENKQAKEKIAQFYKDVSDICKEVVKSNNIIANEGIKLINKYHEEVIKLTSSKDFKIR